MDHSKKHYYASNEEAGRYRGIVYHYDPSGNRQMVVWKSDELFDSEEEAQDAACDWAMENDIEAEME